MADFSNESKNKTLVCSISKKSFRIRFIEIILLALLIVANYILNNTLFLIGIGLEIYLVIYLLGLSMCRLEADNHEVRFVTSNSLIRTIRYKDIKYYYIENKIIGKNLCIVTESSSYIYDLNTFAYLDDFIKLLDKHYVKNMTVVDFKKSKKSKKSKESKDSKEQKEK